MGLDTTHDAWHGAYSAFSRWRTKLADVAGYWTLPIPKRGEQWDPRLRHHYPVIFIDWGHITQDNIFGRWEKTPEDPLIVLIAHSDCEGAIYPEQAAPLADRLEELLPLLVDVEAGGHIGSYREKTQTFVDGLRLACQQGEPLEFH